MEKVNLSVIAERLQAMRSCEKHNNAVWYYKHRDILMEECDSLPHGSGLDSGVTIDLLNSKPDKLVFLAEFHHLNNDGYYSGWTFHKIIATPTFSGFALRITGKDTNGIKAYLYDLFNDTFEVTKQ